MTNPAPVERKLAAPDRPYLLITGDFVRTGGMDVGNFHLADNLARQGVPVHLVAHRVDPALLAYPNVVFHHAPRVRRWTLTGEPALRLLGRVVARRLGGAGVGVRALVNGGNCALRDVNWIHYLHAATSPLGGGGILRRTKVRLAYRWFRSTERTALQRARIVIANSLRTKADIIRWYGIDESIIHPIYYGTDPASFYPASEEERMRAREELKLPAGKFLIVFIGAMGDRRKGFDTLFEAWKRIGPEAAGEAELLVIGTGSELPGWKQRAEQEEAGRSIRFLGFRRDVPAILRASDAVVAPTRYEAFGLAVQEALCCGLPAVVSRAAGVAERYPAALDGLLLDDVESVRELEEKLRLLIAQRGRWKEVMLPTAAKLRSHTWQEMAKAISDVSFR